MARSFNSNSIHFKLYRGTDEKVNQKDTEPKNKSPVYLIKTNPNNFQTLLYKGIEKFWVACPSFDAKSEYKKI